MNETKIAPPVLEGSKVILRPIDLADTALIVKWRNSDSVRKNFIYRELFTAETHINWMNTKVASGEVVQFIIHDKESGLDVGSVYLRDINPIHESAEFGIFIGEDEARGRGIGSEAAALICDYGFDTLKLHRISLRLLGTNAAARRSYEKVGFRHEGTFTDMFKLDGKFTDIEFMAIVKKEA